MDQDNGISGWAGYMLGQMAERNRVSFERTARAVHRRLRNRSATAIGTSISQVEYLDSLVEERDAYIQDLKRYVHGLEGDRAQLHAWGDAMEAHVATLEQTVADLRQRLSASSVDLEVLHEQYDIDTAGLKLENEELRRSLALAGGSPEAAG